MLDTFIKDLDKQGLNFSNTTSMLSNLLLILTFGIGIIFNYFLEELKYSADNNIKNTSDTTIIKKIINIFNDTLNKSAYNVLELTIKWAFIVILLYVFIEVYSGYIKKKRARKIAFYRMCLETLKNIKPLDCCFIHKTNNR